MSEGTYDITITVNGEVIELQLTEEQLHREFPSIAEQIKEAAE